MDVIIAAGGVPQPSDALYPFAQGNPKALLDINGKPMIQWVLDALDQADTINNIIVVGCQERQNELRSAKPITYLPIQKNILKTVQTGGEALLEINPSAQYVVLTSCDIPGITPQSINWAVNASQKGRHDVYYNAITREVMEKRYPSSGRTFTKLKDVDVCGGDLTIVRTSLLSTNKEIFERLFNARKNPLKVASLVGYSTLFQLLTRRLALEEGVKKISQRLGIKGHILLCPHAEIGMDIDKPHHLEMLRQDLS